MRRLFGWNYRRLHGFIGIQYESHCQKLKETCFNSVRAGNRLRVKRERVCVWIKAEILYKIFKNNILTRFKIIQFFAINEKMDNKKNTILWERYIAICLFKNAKRHFCHPAVIGEDHSSLKFSSGVYETFKITCVAFFSITKTRMMIILF